MTINFPWKRYWVRLSETFARDYYGFPEDPEHENYLYRTEKAYSFSQILRHQCLILLGEPGLGKTTVMEEEFLTLKQQLSPNETALYFDLGSYTEASHLINEVFNTQVVLDWMDGNGVLHLFLDSLDEGRIHIKPLTRHLSRELKKLPADRLKLRIACRSAEWPNTFTETLESLWPKTEEDKDKPSKIEQFSLIPLVQRNVKEAALESGLNPEAFVKEIVEKEIVPWAERPVTLNLLLSTFKKEGALPATKWSLYETGCTQLCEESEDRKDAGIQASLTSSQRMAIAGKVFALMLLANKSYIWQGPTGEQGAEFGLQYDDILGRIDFGGGRSIDLPPEQVTEVINTGLFSSRGRHIVVPAHMTYAEFLTARHISSSPINSKATLSLITGADGHLVPQLYEVAGWISSVSPELFNMIASIDPTELLRGDLSQIPSEQIEYLVECCLNGVEDGRVAWPFFRDMSLGKLSHPKLAEQLERHIEDSANRDTRYLAIRIAEACELTELSSLFADIALDRTGDIQTRKAATGAVKEIGDADSCLRLLPLARGDDDDPDDSLKGWSLNALWPDHISASELFTYITPEKSDSIIGGYQHFLAQELVPYLSADDFVPALMWIARNANESFHRFDELSEQILLESLKHVENEEIFDAFTTAIYHIAAHYNSIIQGKAFGKAIHGCFTSFRRRCELVTAFFYQATENPKEHFWHLLEMRKVFRPGSFFTLLNCALEEDDARLAQVYMLTAGRIFDRCHPDQVNTALEFIGNSLVSDEFAWLITPTNLDSDEAATARKRYQRVNRRQKKKKIKHLVTVDDFRNVLHDETIADRWAQLAKLLNYSTSNKEYNLALNISYKNNEMWTLLPEGIKSNVLIEAAKYIEINNPTQREWRRTGRYRWQDYYGIGALSLLTVFDKDRFQKITPQMVRKWIPDILFLPHFSDEEDESNRAFLMGKAYDAAPALFRKLIWAYLVMNKGATPHASLYKLDRCRAFWDESLTDILEEIASLHDLSLPFFASLIRFFFSVSPERANRFAWNSLSLEDEDGTISELQVVSLVGIAKYSSVLEWERLWPIVTRDEETGEKFLFALQHNRNEFDSDRLSLLSERQVADLYIYTFNLFPNNEDPEYSGPVTGRHRIVDLKRLLLEHLTQRGTQEAVSELVRIQSHSPELGWVNYHTTDARINMRTALWIPPSVENLKELFEVAGRRIIQNENQLLEVVMEALEIIEASLHGHTPEITSLWDQDRSKGSSKSPKYYPKDENSYSDFVKNRLDDLLRKKGVIHNREVEIRRPGIGQGERVDIHVDAVTFDEYRQEYDRIKLIIEVKGCWNKGVKTAMETQLRDRYMNEVDCRVGIYLVGWFLCDAWDKDHYQYKDTPKLALEDARDLFNQQAAGLSGDRLEIKAFIMNTSLN